MKQVILSINLDGRLRKLMQLGDTITQHQPIVILIQDPPFNRDRSLRSLLRRVAPGYTLIEKTEEGETESTVKTNVAALVEQNSLDILKIHQRNTIGLASAIGVSVVKKTNDALNLPAKGEMILFSVYIRPRAHHAETEACLRWIEETCRQNEGLSKTIIMGDFNATSCLWCPVNDTANSNESSEKHYRMIKETRGRFIERFTQRIKLSCLNKTNLGPTFTSTRTRSYIDLAFVGNHASRKWNKLSLIDLPPGNGHKILAITTPSSSGNRRPRTNGKYKRIDPGQLTSDNFIELNIRAAPLISGWFNLQIKQIHQRLDKLTDTLYQGIIRAQQGVTTIKEKRAKPKFKLGRTNPRTRRQLNKLKKMEQRVSRKKALIRNHQATSPHTQANDRLQTVRRSIRNDKIRINRVKRSLIDGLNSDELSKSLREMDDPDVWQKTRACQIIAGHTPTNGTQTNRLDIQSQEDIDKLAALKFPFLHRTARDYTKHAIEQKQLFSLRIEIREIDIAIKSLRNKRYTTPEGIRMDVFYKAIEYVKETIYAIVQMSFYTAHIPSACRITQGTLIPKKSAGQFRIVHVSSPMAALLELIALKRLEYRLEAYHLNSAYQFGFSARRSRHDIIARIIEMTLKHKHVHRNKARTLLLSLDIEGAFDNVNQDLLIKKMDSEFRRDPLKYWLAEFILNRNIQIRWGKLTSQVREVCTGVPQGSALGPILWNYMINDLEKDITEPGKTEILKYADDIIVIHNFEHINSKISGAQPYLDKIISKLKDIKLKVRPQKCNSMLIRASKTRTLTPDYQALYISDEPIEKVKSISVLGVHINSNLRLDREESKIEIKLNNTIRWLHDVNLLQAINTADEWRILVDSLVKSRLIINNWPLLTLDASTCKWIDKLYINAIRMIFSWPKNCSSKLILLLTRTNKTHLVTKRMAQVKSLEELGNTYKFLSIMANPQESKKLEENTSHYDNRILKLDQYIRFRARKHFNPDKLIITQNIDDIEELMMQVGPIWALLDRKRGSMLIELLFDEVLQNQFGRHATYPIGYFNSFAILYKIASDRSVTNRNLITSESNSLLQALENYNNKDWRLINLRETLADNGWRVYKIKKNQYCDVDRYVTNIYKKLINRVNPAVEDIESWMRLIDRPDNSDTSQQNTDQWNNLQIQSIQRPYLDDYNSRNDLSKINRREDLEIFCNLQTRIIRQLCLKSDVWQDITPNWIDGPKILMLSGMVRYTNGTLSKDTGADISECCQHNRTHAIHRMHWHNITKEQANRHTTLHRALLCPRFDNLRDKSMEKIERTIGNADWPTTKIENILSNRKACQTLLRFLSRCAMNNSEE